MFLRHSIRGRIRILSPCTHHCVDVRRSCRISRARAARVCSGRIPRQKLGQTINNHEQGWTGVVVRCVGCRNCVVWKRTCRLPVGTGTKTTAVVVDLNFKLKQSANDFLYSSASHYNSPGESPHCTHVCTQLSPNFPLKTRSQVRRLSFFLSGQYTGAGC